MLEVGLRVVRGPNWCWGNQDGGEGFVGTVAEINTSEAEKTVVVQWDNGSRSVCRVGKVDRYDLRVIDNAQVGSIHYNVICDSCETQDIPGIRYKCVICYDYDLCFKCYHNGRHKLSHHFKRFETRKSVGVQLLPRSDAWTLQLRGIFVGAKVIRGFDWEFGNQDGGEGQFGVVKHIGGFGHHSRRSTVSVRWERANTEIYRVGFKGQNDLQFIEAADGGSYYPEHLPILGQTEEEMELNQLIQNIELQQIMSMEISKASEESRHPPKDEEEDEEEEEEEKEPDEPMEQPNRTEQNDSDLIHLGPVESVYASIIRRYVTCSLYAIYEGARPQLVHEFFRAARTSTDEAIREMWEVMSYMTKVPVSSDCECCDTIKARDKSIFIWETVEHGKRFLEKRYKDYMSSVVKSYTQSEDGYAVEYFDIYDLVYNFVGLRFQKEYSGLAKELVDGRPLWAMVYYCLRAGGFAAAATCLKRMGLPEYDHIVILLELYTQKPTNCEIDFLEENVKDAYNTIIRDVSDPFQRMVWALLGCVDEISEVARTVDDFLWFKLSLVRADRDKDNSKYKDLQCQILEEQGERYHDAFKQPLVYFKLLALTGQFEAAVDFLFRTDKYRVEAAHMAIALYELNLLACPEDTSSPLLSINPADRKPARRLNIALIIKSYVSKFEAKYLEETLHYLWLLRKLKECEEGPNLFEVSVGDLIIRTKEYAKILGRVGKNGGRDRGLLDRLYVDCQLFTKNLCQSLVNKEQYEEAVAFYESVNEHNGLLRVMCKVLAEVAHLSEYNDYMAGSLRNKFKNKAETIEEKFIKTGLCNADKNLVDSFIKLKGILKFFDLYFDHRRTPEPTALEFLGELEIVPLKHKELDDRVHTFENFTEDVIKVMPYVLLATMTILRTYSKNIKRAGSLLREHMNWVWEAANCITNFAERFPGVIPKDIMRKLTQMEVVMYA